MDTTFLSILFDHRKASRNIAVQSDTSTVISWVDILLAKLSTFALTVAAGFSCEILVHESKFMRSQREEDCVRASTQLPGVSHCRLFNTHTEALLERWQSLTDVMVSKTQSPAAIRLALRLLFAVYVMGPQLSGRQCWADLEYADSSNPVTTLHTSYTPAILQRL